MDSEKLKQFIIPIALIILLLAGVCYVAPKIIENYQSYTAAQAEIETKKTTVQEKQAKLDEYKRKAEEEQKKEEESATS